jgi:hypothetical protein
MSEMGYPLAKVGNGRQTHVLEPNGDVRCKSHGSGSWYRTRDADGRYQDPALASPVIPLGSVGQPSCHWCQKSLPRDYDKR